MDSIPQKDGRVIAVTDTGELYLDKNGRRICVGKGVSKVVEGYKLGPSFYYDEAGTSLIAGEPGFIYVAVNEDNLYHWKEDRWVCLSDMLSATYDPQGKARDVFAYADTKAGFPRIGPAAAAWELDKGGILFITNDMEIPKVTNLPSLLSAAQLANNGKPAALNGLTAISDLTDDAQYLKAGFKGEDFADITAFKMAIRAAVGVGGAEMSWDQTQYAIIHKEQTGQATASVESTQFYWWSGGGTGAAVRLYANNISSFVEAAYRSAVNGNIHAWDSLTDTMIEASFLRKPPVDDSMITRSMLNKYTGLADVEIFKTLFDSLATEASSSSPYAIPTLTWYQVQHYLWENVYLETNVPDETVYWWKENENKPGSSADKTPLDLLLEDMADLASGRISEDEFKDRFSDQVRIKEELALKKNDDGEDFSTLQLNKTAKPRLIAYASEAYNAGTGKVELTWHQIQYYLINNAPISASEAAKEAYDWAPSWLKAGTSALANLLLLDAEPTAGMKVETSSDGLTTTTTETVTGQDPETRFSTEEATE